MSNDRETRYLPRHKWYLADALLLVRKLQAAVWPLGWHVALGGGVLNHGYSDKDLDIYVLPIYDEERFPRGIQNTEELGVALLDVFSDGPINNVPASLIGAEPHECFQVSAAYAYENKRVDVFVVKP